MTKPISLIQFLIEEKREGHINAQLSLLIEVVARACKRISVATGKGALGGVLGNAGFQAHGAHLVVCAGGWAHGCLP